MRPFNDYYWGFLFILVGAVFLIKYIFHFNFPIIRIIIGAILIYTGIVVVVGGFQVQQNNNMIFTESNIQVDKPEEEYNIIFSRGTVDMSEVSSEEYYRKTKVSVVFGSGAIIINPDIPAVIKIDSVFASANVPNNASVYFGDRNYRTRAFKEGEPYLEIKADVVFGQLNIVENR